MGYALLERAQLLGQNELSKGDHADNSMVVLPIVVCCDREKRRLGLRTKCTSIHLVVDVAKIRSTSLRGGRLFDCPTPPPGTGHSSSLSITQMATLPPHTT